MTINREKLRRMILAEMHQHGIMSMDSTGRIFDHNGPEAESGMIRSNLFTIGKKAHELHDMVGEHDDLPEWVQEKIAVAEGMISSVHDYLTYEYGKHNEPGGPPEGDVIVALNEAKKKNGRVKTKKYHDKEYKATTALVKAIKKGASYEELRDMASWADNPDAVVNAAIIVAKGKPTRAD
jgi:hypothetical protein